jgi:hypothetical protein
MNKNKSSLIDKVNNGFVAVKSVFSGGKMPYYARLNDGTDSYNFELDRRGWMGYLGLKGSYYTPLDNYREYYDKCSPLADMIDLLSDIISNAEIFEIDKDTNEIKKDTEFIRLLNNPNPYQTRTEFIKEAFVNLFTYGISIQYSNFFKNKDLRVSSRIYNVQYYNLKFPKVRNPYELTERKLKDLVLREDLGGGKDRPINYYELAYCYDIGKRGTYGKDGFSHDCFFDPISRLTPLRVSMQTFINTEDSLAYIANNPYMGILTKKNVNGSVAPLNGEEKNDIEKKINGRGKYGASIFGKGALIASNESFDLLSLNPDVKKLQLIEIQNNVKENIRGRFGIPRDIYDITSGTNVGATYENKQTAEAFMIDGICKGKLTGWLESLMQRGELYFERNNTKLVCSFDHFPSIQAFNAESRFEGIKKRLEAYKIAQEAFRTEKELNPEGKMTYEEFMLGQGFDDLLSHKN